MFRTAILLASLVFFTASAPCQTKEPQTQTLEAVLAELRQLRQDLQTAAFAARKAQIVIYRLHVQQSVVDRATERVENVKRQLGQIQNQIRYQSEQIKRFKEMKDRSDNEEQKKELEADISASEQSLEDWNPQVQELETKRIELEAELWAEQARWEDLQQELDRLENTLEQAALQACNRQ